MPSNATNIRLDPRLKEGLLKPSKLRATPLNKTINTALAEFVANDAVALQQEFEVSIKELQALSTRDPDFDQTISRVVDAALSTADDPAQGRPSFPKERETTDLVRNILGA